MKLIKHFYNKLDFFLRKNLKFSREYQGKNEQKENLFERLDGLKKIQAEHKEKLYLERYYLENLKNNSTKRIYLENLAIIELLESNIEVTKEFPKILDIGSKNWFYAVGEYNFFKYNNFNKQIVLTGLEIDAFRVYSDFHTRMDYALYYSKELENCNYIQDDLLKHQGKYDYITWFFPFVTETPLLEWGLPLNLFKPYEMLKHASELLEPEGLIIIVNQDKKEYTIQQEIIKELGLRAEKKGLFRNSFLQYEHERYITLVSNQK